MAEQFELPKFGDGQLEIRLDEKGVAIYGTRDGLRKLASICERLASRSFGSAGTDHVHLEDHALLTATSLNAAVACFDVDNAP